MSWKPNADDAKSPNPAADLSLAEVRCSVALPVFLPVRMGLRFDFSELYPHLPSISKEECTSWIVNDEEHI